MEQLKQLLTAAGIAYKENEPLAAHCTFKIGGPARLFVQSVDRAQLCHRRLHAHSIPWWGCAARFPPAHWMQNS